MRSTSHCLPWLLLALLVTAPASAQLLDLSSLGSKERVTLRAALNYQSLQPGQEAVLAVVVELKPGFHAQSHKPLGENLIPFEVSLTPNAALTVYPPIYPEAVIEEYPALGKVSVYSGQVIAFIPLKVKPDAAIGELKVEAKATYQICDDKSCFPPESKPLVATASMVAAGQPLTPNEPELFSAFDPTVFARLSPVAEKGTKIGFLGWSIELQSNSVLLALMVAFVAGIILNVMPCVLPVVPLKAMGFYEVSQHNRARSILFGAVFSLGLVCTFAILGLLVVTPELLERMIRIIKPDAQIQRLAWGELFANQWFLAGIVLVLVIFSFSLFGAFAVNLPPRIYAFAPRHDTYWGNFLFGILTAILSTPCTFGMLLLLLVWATSQPPALGLLVTITVGLGMAFPYLVLSAVPEVARKMPRTGPWAELVKQMMGFLLLLSAVYFARGFIERWSGPDAYWWSLFAIVLFAGLFLIARTVKFSPRLVPRLVAVVLAVIFILPSAVFAYRITNPPIDWVAYTPEKLDEARKSGRPVMVEFTAAWCGNCLALEGTVFHDQRVVDALKQKDAATIRVDVTRDDAPGWALLRQITPVAAVPLTAIYLSGRDSPIQLAGIYRAEDLIAALDGKSPQ